MNELERLQRENAALRAKLADQTEHPVLAELIRQGCSEETARDAKRCARISGDRRTNFWKVDDAPVESLSVAVSEFLDAHPWFKETAPKPDDRARIEDGKLIFADGRTMDVDMASTSDLFEAAAEPVKPKPIEADPNSAYPSREGAHLPEPLGEDDDSLDSLYQRAGAFPKATR